jgi:hypothetical protein
MSLQRTFVLSILPAACFVNMMKADIVSACGPSYWYAEGAPTVSCLKAQDVTGGLDLRNSCSDPIDLTPAGCDQPCSETLRIAAKGSELLELPESAEDDVELVYNYQLADQTGTITIGYQYNLCDNTTGDCSAASAPGRAPSVGVAAVLASLALLGVRRRNR